MSAGNGVVMSGATGYLGGEKPDSPRPANFPRFRNAEKPTPMPHRLNATVKLVSGYLLSLLLIPVYVSMFPVWQLVNAHLPGSVIAGLPIALTIGVLLALCRLFYRRLRQDTVPFGRTALFTGITLCCIALLLPEAHLPAKKIHVVEYLFLALVVRFAMAPRLQGLALLTSSACFTALLGIHDEFLQGLHPARTYGLSDMLVNTLSGFGGSLIWYACGLFRRPVGPDLPSRPAPGSGLIPLYLLWLLAGILALVIPAFWYRSTIIPLWTTLPLLGAAAGAGLWFWRFPPAWRHGMIAAGTISLPLNLYPILTNVGTFHFY
jgi:hypothetical protein